MDLNPFADDFIEPDPEEVEVFDAPRTTGCTYHAEVLQGSEAWLAMRCGKITASEVKLILTPTLKIANNDKTKTHAYELAFQRITGFVEPHYVSDSMMRGKEDELYARDEYQKHFAPVEEVGFVTTDRYGFTIGYSPDGLVGDDGLIEIKSRGGKYQVQTIANDEVPDEYVMQLQAGLLVTGRKFIDFISYCGGLPMFVKRVEPDPVIQEAIIAATIAFDARVREIEQEYRGTIATMRKVIETERRIDQEMYI